ncbi:MAG: tetratricopeptide repeat protein, partial [Cytophagaceae bacterium]
VRVARLLFESIGWETAAIKYKQFDKVFATLVVALQNLDEEESVDRLLDRYAETVPQKTARYIHLCDTRGYIFWLRGNFDEAIDWATQGDNLKEESQVDTSFDCKHTLALAQRDSGNPSEALAYFLKGHDVSELVADEDSPTFEATTYGNVGRCLHLEGRLDEALICYKRSLNLLEDQTYANASSNRAYARRWTGQIHLQHGQWQLAAAFFIDGIRILGGSAPSRVRELCADLDVARQSDTFVMSETSAARSVRAWMRG